MLLAPGLIVNATELLVVFAIAVITVYYFYYKRCYTYWKRKGVPSLNPQFPTGDLGIAVALGQKSTFIRLENLYQEFKDKGHQYAGIYFYNGPIYFPIDPTMIKSVLISEFEHFVDRGMYINPLEYPMTNHMFSMSGDEWKNIRAKFSPAFTTGKMKAMYNIMMVNCQNLVKTVELERQKSNIIDIKDFLLRMTTDIIGSAAFGIDCNSVKDPDTEFTRMVKKIFQPPTWKLWKLAVEEGLQNPGNIFKLTHTDPIVTHYFTELVKKTVEYRDKNNVVREDFLNICMSMRETIGMSLNDIVAQSYLFFTAGFETSSSAMSFCIHELAYKQDLQDRIRADIHSKLGRDSSKYTYDDVNSLPILDRAIKETLRKYPATPVLNRICVKDYKIPGTDIVIEKNTPVIVSLLGLHRDPENFPDPLDFDPDRFLDTSKMIPYSYLPFGDGPRNCIGMRFGQMQTKLGVACLLNQFKFYACPDKCPKDVIMDPSTLTIVFKLTHGIIVKVEKV